MSRLYKLKGDDQVAKFFPRWDGPYRVIKAYPEAFSYMLDNGNAYPYYASELKPYSTNDTNLFPNHEIPKLSPVLTPDGMQEHEIDQILDAQPHGHSYQYLIQWLRYGPEDDEWLPGKMLENCKVLNQWIEAGGNGLASAE